MSSDYKMYLTFDNESEKLSIVDLPPKIDVSSGTKNESIDIAGLGEITIFQARPALQFSFESYFSPENTTPQQNKDTLLRWKEAGKPVHLIVTGANVNIFVSIENMTYYEQGGDVGTIYYTLFLKEYREPTVRAISVKGIMGIMSASTQRVDNRMQAKTYLAKSGDCLYNIAKGQLGSAERWTDIASLNGIKAPYTIYPNQSLKLPG
ncbi:MULTISPECIES: LysM peptidoglycan-binding domain-containing protein [unclassified Dehalobacter]|uniref:LysM peptidoglycan-binding domain-containing protein n=1 Tax=unclassified Dehalobacter TaxID=2635733 RepID=UPI001046F653|nr:MULTISPECIES: LysM peptidoglycan-binding domain-containing protein [unclassified Dehalobacter]TCX51923.1 hypothetical protein C1I36_06290 [Dehalobacter sp. 14DCB1]TCX52983.1 hypothetical protein C1I38_07970 [Dehalobacter sp. 12DCB1]